MIKRFTILSDKLCIYHEFFSSFCKAKSTKYVILELVYLC